MLELKNIKKEYVTGGVGVMALNGINLAFRKSEFVSILGHSGSGKTTLLNIIGGLDQYTSGDLIIDGISTKEYKDRDWDIYRNHSVGFVFQSYNLIPHQTVLANVELALTLSGISKKERRERAEEALAKVGLSDHILKKPNQLSGGQMQRVAIARALINNPEILLADEPTGALDTDTSLQVMDILKQIAKEKLVIMVTHNPELAEKYSTRIIRLVDGKITDDTDPYTEIPALKRTEENNKKRAGKGRAMSLMTAFSLSLNNLMTKKARTFMTSFAGSIGIMGIALILSVSSGFQAYIDQIQEDTLSTYPLTITSETMDMTSMMASAASAAEAVESGEKDITEQQMMTSMFAQIGTNDLAAFKTYFEENGSHLKSGINSVKYGYNIRPQIYSSDLTYGVVKVNPSNMFSGIPAFSGASLTGTGVFSEMIDNKELLGAQYDILAGRWPEKYDEVILVLQQKGALSDYIVYALGLRDQGELDDMVDKVMNGENVEITSEPMSWEYGDFIGMSFSLVKATDYYRYNAAYDVWEDMRSDDDYMASLVKTAEKLHIVGVICPKEGVSASALSPGIAYTPQLTDHVIESAAETRIVKDQLDDDATDIFSGNTFEEIENDKTKGGLDFNDMISIDTKMLSSAFGMNVSENDIKTMMTSYMGSISSEITTDTAPAAAAFTNTLNTLISDMLNGYITAQADPNTGLASLSSADAATVTSAYLATPSAQQQISALTATYIIPAETFTQTYQSLISGLLSGYISASGDPVSINSAAVAPVVSALTASPVASQTAAQMGVVMTEAAMRANILADVSELSTKLISSMAGSFNVDEKKIAAAFKFNFDEDELTRLMQAYTSSASDNVSYENNLAKLGYADKSKPASMSVYLTDFTGKENFIAFLDGYNDKMEKAGKEEYVINYTDLTGILMSSVKTIVDSVSYVLIAFVAISLVVSSIMIGVITFISVLERTKEIGILRAIGASKKDISRVFNAETMIVGLGAGIIGIVGTVILIIPINMILHKLTNVASLNAVLPAGSAAVLIAISVILTFISGLIPSGAAAKKNPVEALRTE